MVSDRSIIALSMHKAGSSIAERILADFCRERGYHLEIISSKVSGSPLPEAELYIEYQNHMELNGYYYGIARGPYVEHMPKIYDMRVVVQIRDPRDCITSAYYSFGRSHVLPEDPKKRDITLKDREHISSMTIDQYALEQIDNYKHRMNVLRRILESHNDVCRLKYEDMVNDTENWLSSISLFFCQPITPSLSNRLRNKLDFSVQREDVTAHKRQVSPGDYKRKLLPTTIDRLNMGLENELKWFKYE